MPQKWILSWLFLAHLSFAAETNLTETVETSAHPFKVLNVRINPVYLGASIPNVTLEVPVGETTSLGATYIKGKGNSGSKIEEYHSQNSLTSQNIGMEVNYHFSPIGQNGMVLTPAIYYTEYSLQRTDSDGSYSGEAKGVSFCFQASQRWFWSSGINLRLGGGVRLALPEKIETTSNTGKVASIAVPSMSFGTGLGLLVDASFGFAF